MPEVHKDNNQQDELRQSSRQISPFHTHRVPLQHVEGTEDDNHYDNGEEPFRVHDPLC